MPDRPDPNEYSSDLDPAEVSDWFVSLDSVLARKGPATTRRLIQALQLHAFEKGVRFAFNANTPYLNTIPKSREVPYGGDLEIETRIKSIIRWNAMAMVVRANRENPGIGGHISTYASAATLYEVAFNHFIRGHDDGDGDTVYFQGHSSPGIYARAFLEGRLTERDMESFRREARFGRATGGGRGLSSYPHPYLMPDFWEYPTVSMGLGPIMGIYQARFNRYLEDRGLKERSDSKVWVFLGDGETDEPEALGAISLAARERLDNLIFVVNCNLQRLDGPVRGNGKIIQELERIFRGAGWNVIKVIWGSRWDPLIDMDTQGILARRMEEAVDGDYQKYSVSDGAYIREDFFGRDPVLLDMVANFSSEDLRRLNRGGHDSVKVFNAYRAAVGNEGSPTVILAKTIKGYGLGEAGEGKNITHQQKKLNEDELRRFRTRFSIPISDSEVAEAPFYRPPPNSEEIEYLLDRRRALGGFVPARRVTVGPIEPIEDELYSEFSEGTGGRAVSTTMVFVRLLTKLMSDPKAGRLIVPIVSDEARTFGMESLFRKFGIYSHLGQIYEPVDSDMLLYYREATDGAILEEGITEAGCLSSFIAAGTAYARFGINTIPFFIFYSIFGLQRVGDLVWAAGDMMTRGFLIGATSGRTTLAGEGLQHADGHSHLTAQTVPNLVSYDPAYAYELAAIIKRGIERMYAEDDPVFYYITVGNENYPQPSKPSWVTDEEILAGIYLFEEAIDPSLPRVQLFGSGAILNEVRAAAEILRGSFGLDADIWSITSYKQLRRDGIAFEREFRLDPETRRLPLLRRLLQDHPGPVIAASDYMKALPDGIAKWIDRPLYSLGTDGFGRSDTREDLRDYFEVGRNHIAFTALSALYREGGLDSAVLDEARAALGMDRA